MRYSQEKAAFVCWTFMISASDFTKLNALASRLTGVLSTPSAAASSPSTVGVSNGRSSSKLNVSESAKLADIGSHCIVSRIIFRFAICFPLSGWLLRSFICYHQQLLLSLGAFQPNWFYEWALCLYRPYCLSRRRHIGRTNQRRVPPSDVNGR